MQALHQCDHERFGLPPWSYLRALESAIVKAVEAGARDINCASPAGGGHHCLRLLATFGESKQAGPEEYCVFHKYPCTFRNRWGQLHLATDGSGEKQSVSLLMKGDAGSHRLDPV